MRRPSPLLLLAGRSLRADDRRFPPFLLRTAIVAMLLLPLWRAQESVVFFGAPGSSLLSFVAWLDLWALGLAGIALFPALVAEEREQNSLQLLHLAGIGPTGFLLGQSLGALAACGLVLAVQVPFLVLAVALGGTSLAQVGATVVVLAAGLILVYSAALLAGAITRTTRGASRAALLLVPLVTFLPSWFAALEANWLTTRFFASLAPYAPPELLSLVLSGPVDAESFGPLLRGQLLAALVLGVLAILVFRSRSVVSSHAVRERKRRSRSTVRFPTGAAAFRAIADRGPGRAPHWMVALLSHLLLAVVVASASGGGFVAASVLSMQVPLTLLLVAVLATRSTQTVRRERTAGLLLLAGGEHTWLTEQRRMRLGVGLAHLLALATTVLIVMKEEWQAFYAIPWLAAAMWFVDRFGERCGLTYRRAPLAVTLLGGGALLFGTYLGAFLLVAMTAGVEAFMFVSIVGNTCLAAISSALTHRRLVSVYAE